MDLTISNPMTSSSVKMYMILGYLYRQDQRRFLTLIPSSALVALQLSYMLFSNDELDRLALNMYFVALLSNCLFRAIYTSLHPTNFQVNLENFSRLYRGILHSEDEFAKKELIKATYRANLLHRMNNTMCALCGVIYLVYPLTSMDRSLPYGVYIGGLDMLTYPTYHIVYFLEFIITIVLGLTYLLFLNLFIAFILFGFALVQILHHNFETMLLDEDCSSTNNELIARRLRLFIETHTRLIGYVTGMNEIFSTMFLVEIIIFGLLLCALLFLLIIVQKISQIVLTVSMLLMIFIQLFMVYWIANELIEQSGSLQFALYNMPWYHFDRRNRMTILLMLLRTQTPLQIMIGNFAPMTLTIYQSILNATYSYFTILRRSLL